MFWKITDEDETIYYLPEESISRVEAQMQGCLRVSTGYQNYYPIKLEIIKTEQFLEECNQFIEENKSNQVKPKATDDDIAF